jgi:hypothetical protein
MRTRKTTKSTAPRKEPAAEKVYSSKENTDGEFPGYPRYDADEDITRQAKRIDENLDDEVLTQVKHNKEPRTTLDESVGEETGAGDTIADETESDQKSNFDVTNEDIEALGPKDLSMDMGDDEQLKHRTRPVDFSGNDLDVPGSELDDDQEEKGSEDEENNSYSLGGDDKENLDEGQEHERSL